MSEFHNTTEFPNQPLNFDDCNNLICPASRSSYTYAPNLIYAIIPLAGFIIITIGHAIAGIRYRTWPFGICMFLGGLLEALGYLCRMLANNNPFVRITFILQAVVLTFAPIFFCASIYMSLSRIVSVYGEHMSRIKPVWYTRIFITCDVISLITQVAGGIITSSSDTPSTRSLGVNVMLGSIIFQVITIAIFAGLALECAVRIHLAPSSVDRATDLLRANPRWTGFLYAMITATILIFTRCVYRAIEMSQGFHGPLARNQETFFIFESIIIWLSGAVLLAFHPGFAYVYMRNISGKRSGSGDCIVGGIELEEGGREGKTSSRSSA